VKAKTVLVIRNWLLFLVIIIGVIGWAIFMKQIIALEDENIELKQQIQTIQQQKQGFKEGKYTMITNLSSSMYLNRIPANFERINPWTDVNGVSGFDVTINGTHYRYVEGHIEMPQLSLYAPNLHLEVVSEKEWPR
jgi:hypothetical protein